MSRSKTIAVLFYLGAVVIGAALGIAVDRTLVPARLDRMAQNRRALAERFFTDLRFTPAQRVAWDSIRTASWHRDSVLTAPIDPQRDSLRKATNAQLRALLTPEQVKLFDERQARRQRPTDGRR
jgi:hypothetical protein